MKKSAIKFLRKSAGFTLIELLVVIGIIGILLAAILTSLDPLEQFRKAQDSTVKTATVEFVNAVIRYYTTNQKMPWSNTTYTAYPGCTAMTAADAANLSATSYILTNTNVTDCLRRLVDSGEIKPVFTTATDTLKYIYVTSGKDKNAGSNVAGCFRPQSKAQSQDVTCTYNYQGVLTSYTSLGHDTTSNNSTSCYWCTP